MKLLGIEAGRGIAALMVVLLHASFLLLSPDGTKHPLVGNFFGFGRAGVDFFFVLSGFIITYIHYNDLGRAETFSSFWRKRLLRIYPTYWAAFAYLGSILAVSPTRSRLEREPLHILASFSLFPEGTEPILGVAWSLRHEMLFYLLFSIAILNRRVGLTLLGAWFAAVLANSIYAIAIGHPYADRGVGFVVFRVFNIQFLTGIGAAVLIRRGIRWRPRTMFALGVGLFFANGMAEAFLPPVQPEWPPRHWIYAIGGGLAIYGLAVMDLKRAWDVPRPLVLLGGASFSIYLVHQPTLLLLNQALVLSRPVLDMGPELTYLCGVAVAVTAGFLFNRMIERPLLRVGNRMFVAERTVS